jgi:tRNA/rRNA methyltransferase
METNSNLARIQIVLVEPQDGANIGSVCRAMKTMGIEDLAITGDRTYDENRVKTLALHAFDLYERHTRFSTLEAALAESVLSVGASRRRGKNRKYFALLPEQLAQRIDNTGPGRVSIVFGREADGLTDAELNLCHMGVRIPTSPSFPSLNLSQAVQIIAYTLFRELSPAVGFEPIREDRLQHLASTVGDSFEQIDFYKQNEQEEVMRFFRDIFARATLSEREAQRLEKMFIKMARLKVHKGS